MVREPRTWRPGATITLLDNAGTLTLTGSNAVNQTFCRVTIIVPNDNRTFTPSAINIEIWLPETSWNQRYEGVGGGGFAGTISAKASVQSTPTGLVNALNAGYASASTDTGHPSSTGGAFVLNADDFINYGLAIDYFSRSLHELALQSKYIIQQFYDAKPLYSYWNGCSTGGRQGLIEAQDNPDDYDGIWAGSPAVDFDRLSDAQVWPAIVMAQEIGGAGIPQTTFAGVVAAANAACNKVGGFTDVTALGNPIIDDPRECNFDPAVLQCGRPGAPTNGTCLTPKEAKAIKMIWYGPREVGYQGQPTGPRLWFGIEPGASFSGVANTSSTAIIPHNVGGPWIQDWLEQNPSFNVLGIDYPTYQQLFRFSEQRWTRTGASDNPDLSAFAAHGGKVIITHGWADQQIPTQDTVNYYNNVLDKTRATAEAGRRWKTSPACSWCREWATAAALEPADRICSMHSMRWSTGARAEWRQSKLPRRSKIRVARLSKPDRCAPTRRWRVTPALAARTTRAASSVSTSRTTMRLMRRITTPSPTRTASLRN